MASALATLPSHQLLARLRALVRRNNAVEAELLAHLAEVDARRLYLEQAYPSMFAYCVRALHFSEAAAYKRITAARAARRHPELLDAVRAGELHVTAVSLIAAQVTSENRAELIAAARHRTADEIRRLLADRQPRPDVPVSVRHVPAPTPAASALPTAPPNSPPNRATSDGPATAPPEAEPTTTGSPALARASAATQPTPPPAAAERRARTEPLGGERYCVRFTANRETFEQLQALMRHQI
jgi:hypothetical protein